MLKLPFILFSLFLLIYLLVPGPSSINDFPQLPNSTKSNLSGDTTELPNVVGYYSNHYRQFVVNFYRNSYQNKFFLPFLPLRLNYQPEFAFTAIKKHTDSTFLEELVYPMRDSLFVNGMEPFYEDGQSKYWGSIQFELPEGNFDTKTTLRFYPSPLWARLIVWFGIILSFWLIFKFGREAVRDT